MPAPGLLVLHGNRLEQLAETTLAWLAAHPLAPLDDEVLLVQSNGMAEWLKMALATAHGVCASTRVELPSRFVWRAYRALLGRAAVPPVSALDKLPLTWRLMHLLPQLAALPGFAPVAGFLGNGGPGGNGGDAARRLQLAQRLADLFDQYQVYRSDWLQDWAAGHDVLRPALASSAQGAPPVPDDQRWQPALWRAALAALEPAQQQATRALLHQQFLQALQAGPGAQGALEMAALPRRVVLFGTTHIPHQTLEAIAALSAHTQVLIAVPNPCRFHWADTIEGRELLRAPRRRQPPRGTTDLQAVPLQQMHVHGHPLLAAWGRQSRDFVRQLDAFDDVQRARAQFELPRVDLFDEAPGQTLLQQLQVAVRDLVPLHEQRAAPPAALAPDDGSVVFHVAHSAQREVEILHDQLLHLLAHPPGGERLPPLQPRDIVVMVPDIDSFAPAIRSVFGQHGRQHPRHIPWGIADQRDRGHAPLLVALEWLLRAPQQRFAFSALRDLLDVPAVARRFGLAADDLPTLVAWAEGAGVRWGLHAAQRAQLGLASCGDANSWHAGLQRMLLGWAAGELDAGWNGIEPYTEVAGLSAGLAGALAELLDALQAWWVDAQTDRTPAAWGVRLRALLAALFAADTGADTETAADRALLAALDDALSAWLQACELAGFDAPVELAVVREAWLQAVDEPGVARRFRAGGVTFCTLLPMRAIPFEVVCLLGMNDGDYPRRSARSDFDLMALPGQARPGDRSRRDDDRQLMLDALLSARRVLYLSWAGRSQRDNQEQPPSVLVSQLRDHIAALWGAPAVQARTTEHPLQPFSRRYFEPAAAASATPGLLTYAAEWRAAHAPSEAAAAAPAPSAVPDRGPLSVDVDSLAAFVRNPVQAFFRQRLQVRFDERPAAAQDDEAFASAGLDRWSLLDEVLAAARRQVEAGAAGQPPALVQSLVQAQVARLQRAGRLPMAGPGRRVQAELVQTLQPMLAQWLALRAAHPQQHAKLHLSLPAAGTAQDAASARLDDWLVGLRSSADADAGAAPVWIALRASKLADARLQHARVEPLLPAWLRGLAAAACGQPVRCVLVGADAVLHLAAAEPEAARRTLQALLQACHAGLAGRQPLPTALRTGLAWLDDGELQARTAFEGSSFGGAQGEGREPCLARLAPDFATLAALPGFEAATRLLYADLRQWLQGDAVVIAPLPDAVDLPDDDAAPPSAEADADG